MLEGYLGTRKGRPYDNSLELFKVCTVSLDVLVLDKRIFILYSFVFGMIALFDKSYILNLYNNIWESK